MRSPTQFYVYVLLDPRKPGYYRYGKWVFHFEPFYVGKGKDARWKCHTREIRKGKSHKQNKIAKIKAAGFEIGIRFAKKYLTEQEAFEYECALIARIGRGKEGPLTNLTDGGEGASNPTKKTIRKRVAAHAATIAKRTPKESLEIGKKISVGQKRDADVWAARAKKLSVSIAKHMNSLTDREKQQRSAKLSKSGKEVWANMSKADRKKFCKQRSEHQQNMSKQKREEINRKMRAAHAAQSKEQKELRYKLRSEAHFNKSDAEKLAMSKKKSRSAKLAWAKRKANP